MKIYQQILAKKVKSTGPRVPYGNKFVLNESIANVECWNRSGGERFILPKGTEIELCNVYDSFNTTVLVHTPDGEPLYPYCYRFIIPNVLLGKLIGVKMPKKTRDIVGEIMAAEGY
jgi:hypothetical protein